QPSTADDRHGQQGEADSPRVVLQAQRQKRLNDKGIGGKRRKAPRIARPVQDVGVRALGVPDFAEPGLQQRGVGGEREEGQADTRQQNSDELQVGAPGGGIPGAARNPDRQRRKGQREDTHLQSKRN